MKQKKLERVQDITVMILNHLLFVAAAITVLDLFQAENPKILLWVAAFIVPFAFYHVTNKPQKLLPPPFFIVVLGIFSMVEKIMQVNDWKVYYYIITFVYLGGYFLYYFLKQFLQFLVLNETSASNIPERDMLRNGIKQTCFFGAGSFFILMMTAAIDWFKKIMEQIWAWILDALRYIFSKINTSPPVAQEMPVEEAQGTASDIGGAVTEFFFPEYVREIMIAILVGIVFLSFVLGCVIMLLFIYQFIKEHFIVYKKRENISELRKTEDIREYCGVEKRHSPKSSVFDLWNYRKRIRKLYQKKVRKRKQELIGESDEQQLEYLTAKECCDRLSEQNLKLIYEKARYSADDITAEDIRLAKKGND